MKLDRIQQQGTTTKMTPYSAQSDRQDKINTEQRMEIIFKIIEKGLVLALDDKSAINGSENVVEFAFQNFRILLQHFQKISATVDSVPSNQGVYTWSRLPHSTKKDSIIKPLITEYHKRLAVFILNDTTTGGFTNDQLVDILYNIFYHKDEFKVEAHKNVCLGWYFTDWVHDCFSFLEKERFITVLKCANKKYLCSRNEGSIYTLNDYAYIYEKIVGTFDGLEEHFREVFLEIFSKNLMSPREFVFLLKTYGDQFSFIYLKVLSVIQEPAIIASMPADFSKMIWREIWFFVVGFALPLEKGCVSGQYHDIRALEKRIKKRQDWNIYFPSNVRPLLTDQSISIMRETEFYDN